LSTGAGRKNIFMRILLGLLGLCIVALLSLRLLVLPHYDAKLNAVSARSSFPVSARAQHLHARSFVADMHADSLLWGRDLGKQQSRGHVDLPRLRQGGVDLQVFSVVSQVPHGLNYASNPARPDMLPLLFIASWRHPQSWFSPKRRHHA